MALELTSPTPLKVAVVSDLHFANENEIGDSSNHSWLIFKADGEMTNNFWSSLLEKIDKDNIRADILVCPGDITTHSERSALEFAWQKLNELAKALECSLLVTATGNHDVNSRGPRLDNPIRDLELNHSIVENLKLLAPPYPLVDFEATPDSNSHDNRIKYFGADYLLYTKHKLCNIVSLNSCSGHSSASASYERGYVSKSTLKWLEEEFESKDIRSSRKLGILVCHHHPIVHPDHELGEYDFMKGGNELLKLLSKFGKWIVIHGHKHHAKLSYHADGSKHTVVFSAGTLSHHKDNLGEHFANQFYVMDISLPLSKGPPKGTFDVYSWRANWWDKSYSQADGVYSGVGFGEVGCIEVLAEKIEKEVRPVTGIAWEDVVNIYPELRNRIPRDLEHLKEILDSLHIDMHTNSDGSILKLERSEVKSGS